MDLRAHPLFMPVLFGLFATWTAPADAARPFVTDDARLTTAGSCQLESWLRLFDKAQELWALPACNPSGNLEMTLGGGINHVEGQTSHADVIAQIKTLFKPLSPQAWGVGLSVGTNHRASTVPGPNGLGGNYAYIPMSYGFANDQGALHINIGTLRPKGDQRWINTWGTGVEWKLSSSVLGIAEVYGDGDRNSFVQTGARLSLVPDLLQVDATVGMPMGGGQSGTWISLGVRYTPAQF